MARGQRPRSRGWLSRMRREPVEGAEGRHHSGRHPWVLPHTTALARQEGCCKGPGSLRPRRVSSLQEFSAQGAHDSPVAPPGVCSAPAILPLHSASRGLRRRLPFLLQQVHLVHALPAADGSVLVRPQGAVQPLPEGTQRAVLSRHGHPHGNLAARLKRVETSAPGCLPLAVCPRSLLTWR